MYNKLRKKEANKKYYGSNKKNWKSYQRTQRQRIRAFIVEYKKTKVCEKCGYADYRALVFHHAGNKEFNISKATVHKYSQERLIKEMEACSIICGNCHLIIHYREDAGMSERPKEPDSKLKAKLKAN